jgi:hypothetical protein
MAFHRDVYQRVMSFARAHLKEHGENCPTDATSILVEHNRTNAMNIALRASLVRPQTNGRVRLTRPAVDVNVSVLFTRVESSRVRVLFVVSRISVW